MLDLYPPLVLVAHFAFVALASFADQMPTFICAHFLPFYFFVADPATELALYLF